MESTRSTRAVIDLACLERNWERLRAAHSHGRLFAVIKANAYGHGLLPCTRFLQGLGQDRFAVALLDEALALRHGGIRGRILVLGPPEPGTLPLYARHRIEATITSLALLREAIATAGQVSSAVRGPAAGQRPAAEPERLAVHLKCDTGMGRVGFPPDALDAVRALLAAAPPGGAATSLAVRGVYSHLAESEAMESTHPFQQLAAFERWHAGLRAVLDGGGADPVEFHLANSAGLLRDARLHLDCARVGYALWAPPAFQPPQAAPAAVTGWESVLSLRTRVSHVKVMADGDTLGYGRTYRCRAGEVIATLAVGYGDGLPRALGNRGQVLLAGRRRPIVGNVSMDQLTVSLGRADSGAAALPCAVGDEAILLGGAGGMGTSAGPGPDAGPVFAPDAAPIGVEELAGWAGTIGYEVLTHLGARIPREYVYDGKPVSEP